jgi:hypothetical protein
MAEHTLFLGGHDARGIDHAPLLRDLLGLLVDGCQQATRLYVDGRSTAPGMVPSWLESAASFSVTALHAHTIALAAPPLVDVAGEGAPRQEMFAAVPPGKSSLDLLEDSLEDALEGRADSDRYDPPLMATLEGFGKLARYGVEEIQVINGRTLRIDRRGIEAIRSLRSRTPQDRRVMVAGKLETIRHSDRAFTLVLSSGEVLRGVATEQIEPSELASLFGKPTLVSGLAKFRPSGSVLRVEAERIEPAADSDISLWSALPRPLARVLDARTLRKPQGPGSGLAAIFGKWPGTESDEEILRALEEMS